LYRYWQELQLSISNFKQLLLDLSLEAVAGAISCGSTSIEFIGALFADGKKIAPLWNPL